MEKFEKGYLKYFNEISQIPRGSGNLKRIVEYIREFAESRNLKFYTDESDNCIVWKDGIGKGKNKKPVIVTGHTDMVCVKTENCKTDMQNEGLDLRIDDDFIYAQDTSLGGDDGIAVAYMLALLDNNDIEMPPIEAVFTADEEIGMIGAGKLNTDVLKSRTMINVDSEQEGVFVVGCAGAVRLNVGFKPNTVKMNGNLLTLNMSGFTGGHSGVDIIYGRANANVEIMRLCTALEEKQLAYVFSVKGGIRDNVIPEGALAELLVPCGKKEAAEEFIHKSFAEIKEKYKATDAKLNFSYKIDDCAEKDVACISEIAAFFRDCPNGVMKMTEGSAELAETSLNFGILKLNTDEIKAGILIRSMKNSEKAKLCDFVAELALKCGAEVSKSGDYSAWEVNKDSEIKNKMMDVYQRLFNKKPRLSAFHGGVECGVFMGKLPDMDCISIGPDILDIHTVNERMSLSSAERTYELLVSTLKEL